jgi:hypothetical protein
MLPISYNIYTMQSIVVKLCSSMNKTIQYNTLVHILDMQVLICVKMKKGGGGRRS